MTQTMTIGADRMGTKDDSAYHLAREREDAKALRHALAIQGESIRQLARERDHARRGETLCWLENEKLKHAWDEEQRLHELTINSLRKTTAEVVRLSGIMKQKRTRRK